MSPSSAGRQRRSLPRSGSPLWGAVLFGNGPECSDASDGTWEDAPGKIPPDGASGQNRCKGPLPLCRARRQPVYAGRPGKDGRASRQGTYRGTSPYDSPAAGAGGDRSRASPGGAVCPGSGTGTAGAAPSALPYVRNGTAAAGRRLRRRGKKRLVAVGACHLRAFGLWKLVHRSTLRQRPGVPGNALRRIFRCLPVMGPGAAAGRVAGSGPVWKITTLLED